METPFCKACHASLATAKSLGQKNNYNLLSCPDCCTMTVDPFPTAEQLAAFYLGYKGTSDYTTKKTSKVKRAKRRIKNLLRFTTGKRFLDIGCNYGFSVKAAQDLGLDAFGIDIDETAVTASRAMFGEKCFETISVQDYAARGGKADIIYTSEVIEHVPDPDTFVKAIADILSQGGILYLTTPDSGHWHVPGKFPDWDQVMPPEHLTLFTRRGMAGLLKKHGLQVEKFFFAFKPGMQLIARKA